MATNRKSRSLDIVRMLKTAIKNEINWQRQNRELVRQYLQNGKRDAEKLKADEQLLTGSIDSLYWVLDEIEELEEINK